MKFKNILLGAIFSAGLLVGCNSSENNDNVSEGTEVAQTQENTTAPDDQQARHVEVIAENMEYKPNELRAKPGEKLHVTLINNAEHEHNIEFELPAGEQELPTAVQPGNRASLTITAPQEAGTYTIYCPVKDHKEKGMTGKLIVE